MSNLTFKQKIKFILALWSALSSFVLITVLAFKSIPEHNADLYNVLATAYITGSVIMVYSFYFGDSDAVEQ